jgi:chitinase
MTNRNLFQAVLSSLILIIGGSISTIAQQKGKPVIIGYVGGFNGNIIQTSQIDPHKLTHINYAFIDVKDNRAWLTNGATDTINFRLLNELKKDNADLKILISIGGWTWSKNFSDAVLSDTSCKNFSQSAVDIVLKYNLDGVDIDWEYPGMIGDSNVFRPEDRQNYTSLFRNLREIFDVNTRQTGKKYLVTTAIGGSREFLQHTQMEIAQNYLDYINLMAYDLDESYDNMAAHHSNLFSPPNMPWIYSGDVCVKNLKAVGVNPSKLVLGVPFYGKGKAVKSSGNNGLYQIPAPMRQWFEGGIFYGGGYTYMKDSLVNQKGFVRYWDAESKTPYLFNAEKKVIITYDDEESMKLKCDYILNNKLGGIMFWEYSSDQKHYLLNVINKAFGYK